jgi:hypothetical protein
VWFFWRAHLLFGKVKVLTCVNQRFHWNFYIWNLRNKINGYLYMIQRCYREKVRCRLEVRAYGSVFSWVAVNKGIGLGTWLGKHRDVLGPWRHYTDVTKAASASVQLQRCRSLVATDQLYAAVETRTIQQGWWICWRHKIDLHMSGRFTILLERHSTHIFRTTQHDGTIQRPHPRWPAACRANP